MILCQCYGDKALRKASNKCEGFCRECKARDERGAECTGVHEHRREEQQRGNRGKRRAISGDNSGEETPVPISNTEVKLPSADDTWREAARESRSLPVYFLHGSVYSDPILAPWSSG